MLEYSTRSETGRKIYCVVWKPRAAQTERPTAIYIVADERVMSAQRCVIYKVDWR